MKIYAYPCLIAFLVFSLPVLADQTSPPDAFLDQPVPASLIPQSANPKLKSTESPFLQFNSFEERMKNLQAVAQHPIIYPEGFADFIQTEDSKSNWEKGFVLFSAERDGAPAGNTVRDYSTSSLNAMNLTWKYDSVRDTITTDFGWHRDDSRPSAELVRVLARTRPPSSDELIRQSILKEKDEKNDPWLVAFDALLSKPQNFPRAWKLRFIDDTRRHFTPSFVDNIFAKKMRDNKGREHFLVANVHSAITNKDSGSLCYYLFDESGKFEKGGLLNGGRSFGEARAWLDWGKTNLTIGSYESISYFASSVAEASFVLTERGLVLKEPGHGIYARGLGEVLYDTSP